jgi:membrane protease subunit HflC
MTGRARWFVAAFGVLGLLTVYSTLYTVSEQEQVVITQFGRPIGKAVTDPGLHVKLPFAQEANVFDKRWLEWNGDPNQVPTRDKKYIWVATYARWRIANPLLFFQRLRDERGAQSRLDDIIDGETRNVIASHNLIEIIRASNRVFEKAEEVEDVMETEAMRQVELGRDKITRLILERASQIVPDYGIELVDVQIQRVNYIDSVQAKVFERMISERKRIADRYRSEGQGKSAEIRGKKERELKVIESEAYRKTQEIMGRGDAEATAIYADAYNRNRGLYEFTKTMESYRKSIDKDTWLVLSTNASVFRYLQSPDVAPDTGVRGGLPKP